MKALLLCGGFAKRLGILTINKPKALLEVEGKPVINYTIEKLNNIEDIDEIIISTNKKFEDHFRKWLETLHSSKEISLIAEPSNSEEEKLGAVAAVQYAIEHSRIDEDMFLIMGDNMFSFDLNRVVKQFKALRTPCNVVFDVGSRHKAKLYGVPQITESLIIKFREKPEFTDSSMISTGLYLFTKDSLKLVSEYLQKSDKKDRFGDFMSWLIEYTPVHAIHSEGMWFDIGNKEVLEQAKKWARTVKPMTQ